ncbi:Vacuolar protein sorting-associated protein 20 [Mortierella alpina]|nr:Vacuolar protein sorting-associated protein 20 [Mortierella alpina]
MGSSASKGSKITAHDRAILDLKVQRDKLKQYHKRLDLVIAKELGLAKRHLANGEKKSALLALRRKKFQEGLLEKTQLQMTNLDELTFSIEQALVEKQVFEGLTAGNQVLKELQKEMSLSDVEKLMDETAESIAYQNEIDELLSTRLSVAEEEDIERELDEMVEEETKAKLPSIPAPSEQERQLESQEQAEPASQRLTLWLKAQSEADQLVETMAAQTRCVIDGLRPCRRRERSRKRRQGQQRIHLDPRLGEGAGKGTPTLTPAASVKYDSALPLRDLSKRGQRNGSEHSDSAPNAMSAPGHIGATMVETKGVEDKRGDQAPERATGEEELWEFIVGWCLVGCVFTGAALIVAANLLAQDANSTETAWTFDVDDGDNLMDTIVANVMKMAMDIRHVGDQLMEHGIFVFVAGINGFVLVRQRVFGRWRRYQTGLLEEDVLGAKSLRAAAAAVDEERLADPTQLTNERGSLFYEHCHDDGKVIHAHAHRASEDTVSIVCREEIRATATATSASTSGTSDGHQRRNTVDSRVQKSGDEDTDSPDFRSMSFLAWFNYLQVGILVIEFLQLFSFPLRELLEYYRQVEKTSVLYASAKGVLNAFSAAAAAATEPSVEPSTADQSHELGTNLDQTAKQPSHAAIWFEKVPLLLNTSSWPKPESERNVSTAEDWIQWISNITSTVANDTIAALGQDGVRKMRDHVVQVASGVALQGLSPGTKLNHHEGLPQPTSSPTPDAPADISNDGDIVMQVVNSLGLQPSINTHDWYLLRFWSCFVAVLCGWILAVSIHTWNRRCRRLRREGHSQHEAISMGWVSCFIPVVSVLYLPILSTFLSSAACQSQAIHAYARERLARLEQRHTWDSYGSFQASDILHAVVATLLDTAPTATPSAKSLLCTGPQIQPSLYLAASLLGYTLAYLLFMVFLTSFERVPTKGEICYRPNGVAVLKNLGLLLAVDYLLIQLPSQRRFRGLVSMAIMLAMACYTIRMKPCYWDKMNYWRTFSFSCVLYASLLVALLCPSPAPDKVKGDRVGGRWVMAPHLKMGSGWSLGGGPKAMFAWIAAGWVILVLGFVFVDRVFLRHWTKREKQTAATDAVQPYIR